MDEGDGLSHQMKAMLLLQPVPTAVTFKGMSRDKTQVIAL